MDAVDLRVAGIVTAIAWIAANMPLFAAILRHRGSFSDFWLTVTASPNRYLFSFLFLPGIYLAAFIVWGLARKSISGISPTQHPVLALLSSTPALVLSSMALCSAVALWDYAAGNYNNADLERPFGLAALRARDLLLDPDAMVTPQATTSSPQGIPPDLLQTAKALSSGAITDKSVAQSYLRQVASERHRLVDRFMLHTNLVNVWFFTLAIWLPSWLLIVLALARQAAAVTDQPTFDVCKFPVLFCLITFSIWGSLRSYELHEFRESMGIESREVIDLAIAAVVLLVWCLLTAWAFDLGAIELAGAALIPLGFMIGSQFFTSLLRSSCGSAMSVANFAILVLLWCISCGAFATVFLGGKI